MAFKLLPNRISKTLPPDAEAQAAAAFQVLFNLLGPATPITEEEYDALSFISDKRKLVADDYHAVMRNNPEFLEEPPIEEVEKDRRYYEFGDFMEAQMRQMESHRIREQNLAGAEYDNATKSFKSTVIYKAGRNNSRAQLALKQLEDIDKRQPQKGPKAGGTTPPPPTPPPGA